MILLLKLVISKANFTFLSVYAPQANLLKAIKERFYNQQQRIVAKVAATEILILVDDWNSHVGAVIGVYSYP